MDKINRLTALVVAAFEKEAIRRLVFSRPISGEVKKISARQVAHRGQRIMAFEYSLPGDTVSHKNITVENLEAFVAETAANYHQVNLITTLGEVEYKISSSGKVALLGAEKLERKLAGEAPRFESAIEALDRKKSYILSGNEDFLIKLGVSDKTGRVHDKKQGKFRQINRFLEHIEGIYPEFDEGDILIYDLCCGKSYLSFAVYYYLTVVKERRVRLYGIDLKRDVIRWCDDLARSLGYSGMRFLCDDVKNTPTDEKPNMVISLHACDVATDIVIARAIELGAKVVLSTPCCHRYLRDRIATKELSFVTRFPHLANKLSESITDALRLMRLEAAGYSVSALELTDPDDTPKNTLLRAIYRGGDTQREKDEYASTLKLILGEGSDDYLKGF